MVKALIKKQLLEVFSFFWRDRKKNTTLKGGKLVGTIFIYLILYGLVCVVFASLSLSMCIAFTPVGLDWLYFAAIGMFAVLFGTFASAFSANSSLYQAKDNDILLSMPIKPRTLLFVRLIGIYSIGLLYELIIMLPAILIYFVIGKPNPLGIILSTLTTLIISFFILTLSAVFGWLVAFISKKTKNKSFITVAVSIIFFGLYYFFSSQVSGFIETFIEQAVISGNSLKESIFPIYIIGSAFSGNPLSFLIVASVVAVLFFAVYYVLSKSYLGIVTSNKGEKKKKYTAQAVKAGNSNSALFRRELKRFTKSSTYMLNCGLGSVLMIAAAVALFFNRDFVNQITTVFAQEEGFVALIACGMLCLISSMNDITAPSVSLEGKNIWIVQSLPVTSWQVLRAKLNLHLVLTIPPFAVLIAAVEILTTPSPIYAILIPVFCFLFVILSAELGLVINLKAPNLDWTSEIVPIKQSSGVLFALFGGWAIVLLLGALYFAVASFIPPLVYLIFITVLIAAASVLTMMWLKNRGSKIFDSL